MGSPYAGGELVDQDDNNINNGNCKCVIVPLSFLRVITLVFVGTASVYFTSLNMYQCPA